MSRTSQGGFWSMTVGEREASLKKLEEALRVANGNPQHLFNRFRTDNEYVTKVATFMVQCANGVPVVTHSQAGVKELPIPAIEKPMSPFKFDRTRDQWELLKDVGFAPVLTESSKLEFFSILNEGEERINGDEMAKRAVKLNANLGQRHAEWLLEHQKIIPAELRGKYLVFPGTVWRSPRGDRRVPCLYWDGHRWSLLFGWLGRGWFSGGRLVRLCESPALERSLV